MKWYLFFLILLFSVTSQAADTIIVKKDSRLDLLTQKQASINKRSSMMTSAGQYKGYRIQALSTNRRDDAFKVKADLMAAFPDQKCYIIFQSPNFKVRIGNFLKRSEAENFRKQLVYVYPQGGYIVEDAIDYAEKGEDENSNQ